MGLIGQVGPSGEGGGVVTVLSQTVTLTNAQIKALPTTPIVIVPAPGSGQAIWPIAGQIFFDATAGAYTVPLDTWLCFSNEDDDIVSIVANAKAALQGGLAFGYSLLPSFTVGTGDYDGFMLASSDTAPKENQALVFGDYSGGTVYTLGNASNSGTVTALYTIIDV